VQQQPRGRGRRPSPSPWLWPGQIERPRPSSWRPATLPLRRRRHSHPPLPPTAPVEAALSRTLAGLALARAGERERAAAELQRSARDFETCGALRYRDQAERELRKLGIRIHRRTRRGTDDSSGLESLTERELQLARLVADRKTNPEIAAELFLSQKTVESHLRNIFHKLGVASRVEVARAVERGEHTGSAAGH
jgi:DNA-binding CsgD family transcriptional regulator